MHLGRAQLTGSQFPWSTGELRRGTVDANNDRSVEGGVTPALGASQRVYQLGEPLKLLDLVGDDKLLVLQTERVDQKLLNVKVLLPDLDVLVHHALARVHAHQIPLLGL